MDDKDWREFEEFVKRELNHEDDCSYRRIAKMFISKLLKDCDEEVNYYENNIYYMLFSYRNNSFIICNKIYMDR